MCLDIFEAVIFMLFYLKCTLYLLIVVFGRFTRFEDINISITEPTVPDFIPNISEFNLCDQVFNVMKQFISHFIRIQAFNLIFVICKLDGRKV